MFEKIRKDFIDGNKIIFYAGAAHTGRQIIGTKQRGKNIIPIIRMQAIS